MLLFEPSSNLLKCSWHCALSATLYRSLSVLLIRFLHSSLLPRTPSKRETPARKCSSPMNCLFCEGGDTGVVNSRLQKRENNVWRRRKCKGCGTVFTTIEKADLSYSIRVASEGSNEPLKPFFRSKLQISIYKCCRHLEQPEIVSDELTNTVIAKLTRKKTALLKKQDITRVTLDVLKRFDKAAAVQYKAFHQK